MRISIVIIIMACFAAGGFTVDSRGEEDTKKQAMVASGMINSVDWVASEISVNGVKFKVPSGASITKGSDVVGFSEANVGDSVTVYYTMDSNIPQVYEMNIDYRGDFS